MELHWTVKGFPLARKMVRQSFFQFVFIRVNSRLLFFYQRSSAAELLWLNADC